ncbi:hypothetical protein NO932_11820 [Pelagibacterium sp. 26DY04]|uniref:hypothetical protein n=1 Tax=Pelagibacterium sp. 26DY04 TaxID=2967130 RepID=UPI002816502E|nr:hypothetical protein [Pelagibacterium sp. 26DY04]WMT85616.1 hypothetical protein NO932_11820 [Pelagibacterium sp. 26DY04]
MRKLSPDEQRARDLIAANGGYYCPSDEALAEPIIMDTLKGLIRKKRLYAIEADVPAFRLTVEGMRDA